jgi:hypothetical protein
LWNGKDIEIRRAGLLLAEKSLFTTISWSKPQGQPDNQLAVLKDLEIHQATTSSAEIRLETSTTPLSAGFCSSKRFTPTIRSPGQGGQMLVMLPTNDLDFGGVLPHQVENRAWRRLELWRRGI